ncbi:hypothetical protein [Nitrospira sp. M1]
MSTEYPSSPPSSGRHPCQSGDRSTQEKLSNTQRLAAEARLLRALELSDASLELQRTCLKKP